MPLHYLLYWCIYIISLAIFSLFWYFDISYYCHCCHIDITIYTFSIFSLRYYYYYAEMFSLIIAAPLLLLMPLRYYILILPLLFSLLCHYIIIHTAYIIDIDAFADDIIYWYFAAISAAIAFAICHYAFLCAMIHYLFCHIFAIILFSLIWCFRYMLIILRHISAMPFSFSLRFHY